MKSNLSYQVFDCPSYVDFLHLALGGTTDRQTRKPRGSLTKLAAHLNCHTSFVAQVLSGQSQLNTDQILLVSEYFGLEEPSRDHLVDLLLMERSALEPARKYFQAKIKTRRKLRENLNERWSIQSQLSESENWAFFSSWLNQLVYSLLHLPGLNTISSLAKAANVPTERIEEILQILISLRLVEKSGTRFKPLKNLLHLSKTSNVIRPHHQSWRHRALEEFTKGDLSGLHYSGAITLSKQDALKLRDQLLTFLDSVRRTAGQSTSEECHVLLIDFFKAFEAPND